VRLRQASHPLFKPRGRIGAIDPYLAPPRDTSNNRQDTSLDQSQAIIRAGRGRDRGHEQPRLVDVQETVDKTSQVASF
jgi:hypothetical protein